MNQMNPTSLETYCRCPKQYEYRYVHKLKTHRVSKSQMLGQCFHLVMEHCLDSPEGQRQFLQMKTRPERIDVLMHTLGLLQKFSDVGLDPFTTQLTLKELLLSQSEIETQWLTQTEASPAITERKATVELPDADLKFEIRIDRIDKCKEGYWLIDYKTQETPPSWKAISKFELLQPWIYALHGLESFGDDFIGFVYFLPKKQMIRPIMIYKDALIKQAQSWLPQKKYLMTSELLKEKEQALIQHIQHIVAQIHASNFHIETPPLNVCRVCSYRHACEVISNAT